eukprot:CAMPEP_0197245664 /NCGR_PEP_ID=MMETSP1429-20130617/10389_1 /TAXON_ID=49237 /ORGANISM="Chaetoceros  sp., Strain UNC1202" /LENGTH=225 /DNA_ID=CAMNT_0042706203 /DNA_START=113 /DNA_END=790 /DNA_ORIENTATION=+
MRVTPPQLVHNLSVLRATLTQFHPLVIEGPGVARDSRAAAVVANRIVTNVKGHLELRKIKKEIILVTQGDPLEETGISAITRIVADELKVKKILVCLDDYIFAEHSPNADRYGVTYETKYSQLVEILKEHDDKLFDKLIADTDRSIEDKDQRRQKAGKDPLADWYRHFALLQEVTKVAMKIVAGDITVAHTIAEEEINEFSVTSAWPIGVNLGIIDYDNDMLSYT